MQAREDEGAFTSPNAWLAEGLATQLISLAERPLTDTLAAEVAAILDGGILRAVHVHELARALHIDKRFKDIVERKGRAHVLHKLLFCLGGADQERLIKPSADRASQKWAANLWRDTKLASEKFYLRCRYLRKQSVASRVETQDELRNLHAAPYDFAPLQVNTRSSLQPSVESSMEGAGSSHLASETGWEVGRRERRCTVGLLLLKAARPQAGNLSPFVTLSSWTDIIRYIVELSIVDHPDWIPRPQPREIHKLRQLAWHLECELYLMKSLVNELRLSACEATRNGRRAAEREAFAVAALAAARQLHAAELLLKDDEITEVKKAACREIKKVRKEWQADMVEWQLEVNHTTNAYVDLLREQDAEHRRSQCEYVYKRDEATEKVSVPLLHHPPHLTHTSVRGRKMERD